QVRAQSAAGAEAMDLAEDFTQLVRQRQPAQLDSWLTRAATCPLTALRRVAAGLYEDYQAVKAGGTLPWSTGPVEGHINRLKMLKRQMFGRAHLDLLRHRFLRTPRGAQAQASEPRVPSPPSAAAASPRAPPEAGHVMRSDTPHRVEIGARGWAAIGVLATRPPSC